MEVQEGRKGIPSLLSSQGECIASNITQLIGWTPLIELKNIAKNDGIDARPIGKIEPYQPLSSVKDRSALRLIEDAEEKALISPGITTLVAVTSGNLGIGLAFVAARKGYKFIAVMPAKVGIDKQILLRYLGVEVILVDASRHGFKGLLDRVEQLEEEMEHVYVVDQFTNPANSDAHFRWTGPEIWKDTEGKVDIFVAASGSGGTLTGTGRFLKMKNPSVKLICVEPAESAVISGGEPAYHNIQGISPGFVPETLDTSQIDEIVTVTTQEAMDMARRLAMEEGLLVVAAELLDVRRSQKLHMVKDLKIEKARYRYEVEIGKSPPLSDEEVWSELREKAIELRDEWRLENRKAFANIWSDMVYGIVLFLLICFNPSKVAVLKFTGYKLLNNISDSGKAFLIILVSDILLGYHSEPGWHTLTEVILEHYGFEVDQAAVTFFVCLVPVALDVFIKFWVYKYLPRLSPSVGNILDEVKRH